ncbi:hypothetical protein VN12_15910 [Pirellula sp. SH-Sr6A]|nr:hypothetical protein VN12_15910 [Pirellula sp. SH-Sr6A]
MDEQDTQDLQSQSNLKFGSITEVIIALQEKRLTVQFCTVEHHPVHPAHPCSFENAVIFDSCPLPQATRVF